MVNILLLSSTKEILTDLAITFCFAFALGFAFVLKVSAAFLAVFFVAAVFLSFFSTFLVSLETDEVADFLSFALSLVLPFFLVLSFCLSLPKSQIEPPLVMFIYLLKQNYHDCLKFLEKASILSFKRFGDY